MAKRGAEEPLDVGAESPASKKARIQDALEDELPPPPPEQDSVANGANGHATADVAGLAGASAARQAELEKLEAIDQEEEAAADDENDESAVRAQQRLPDQRYSDLYLDTISRKNLDFDFEKLCSVTLGNINIYACLVCGKYFAGRGPKTPAYFHALEIGHHVYIHMETKKVYVLPEGYEVKNKSLDDIKYVVDPKFSPEEVKSIDRRKPGEEEGSRESWDLWGKKYVPGFVGMNNIKANDYLNVVVQALAHVPPLRNFFLLEDFSSRPQLPQRFSTLVRKIWNPRAFKSHVSPHELIQEISLRSSKKFLLTSQADPIEFLSWFLNHLHLSLGGSKTKPQTSLIQKTFQGTLRVESQTITAHADATDRLRFEGNPDTIRSQTSPFLILTLDLPPAPLFQDGVEAKNIIPQIPLTKVLEKYNGIATQERMNTRMRYRLLSPLPPFLIMHVKRFQPNKFLGSQRNPTIVTFHPRGLDMRPFVERPEGREGEGEQEPLLYDLVANITYEGVKVRDDSVEGEAERKVWKAQVREGGATNAPGEGHGGPQWWEMQDLFVDRTNGELLSTKESYIMVWERRRKGVGSSGKGGGKSG
ncbi:hypothetical protein D0869_14642 [Hortaea werneckii]|uniref:USP domain-containing protein n=1 Tax=Hortaea werneckii TaxID=91943 RepID=A0A3M6Y5G9_HORWE|nr:cysteine proteinase [Hortaea werneckii]KAI7588604.1 cysteine proteinase [Hortaea werneckii]RMX72413.1 hypothetical protein D0869_14642 [Hortaea werneckii]RMX98178.1 hypothetical protein D0867_12524 [Hortaea werneckii]RMY00620.1 hypothetical protein D0868_08912 [Hortaea werneckii]